MSRRLVLRRPLALLLAVLALLAAAVLGVAWWRQHAQARDQDELQRFCAGLDATRTLVVWGGHPRLSPAALRWPAPAPPVLVTPAGGGAPAALPPWPGITQLVVVATGADGRPVLVLDELPPGTVLDAAAVNAALQRARAPTR